MSRVVGVDVGTFTDVVVLDGQSVVGRKVRTTPDQSDGVAQALSGWIDDATTILHGTTAGTNALIEEEAQRRHGHRAASRTFSRSAVRARPSLYDPFVDRPVALSLEVCELDTRATSRPSAPWSSRPTPKLWRWLWFGPMDPSEEIHLGERLQDMVDVPVSVGALVSPQFGNTSASPPPSSMPI